MENPSVTPGEAFGMWTMKWCNACQQELPSPRFYPDLKNPGRFLSWCKECRSNARRVTERSPRGRLVKYRNNAKRKAIKLSLPHVDYTAQEIFDREQGKCSICNLQVDPDNYHLDHVVPLQVPGDVMLSFRVFANPGDVPWNVTIAHPVCNVSKSNRMTSRDAAKYYELRKMYGV